MMIDFTATVNHYEAKIKRIKELEKEFRELTFDMASNPEDKPTEWPRVFLMKAQDPGPRFGPDCNHICILKSILEMTERFQERGFMMNSQRIVVLYNVFINPSGLTRNQILKHFIHEWNLPTEDITYIKKLTVYFGAPKANQNCPKLREIFRQAFNLPLRSKNED